MKEFAGTGALVRLALRRDRIVLPVWVVMLALMPMSVASSFASLYPTDQALQALANQIAGSQAEVGMLGHVYAPSLGGITAWRWTVAGMILAGLASLLTVIRHTRADEEAGRRELLGSTVVGRHAPLSAALIVTFIAVTVMAALSAVGLISIGLPAAGSIALGLSIAAAGWVIAAVAGVAAQMTQGARAARGIAGTAIGVFYLTRAIGDTSGEQGALSWLSWASPAGWARFTRPYAGEQWWVFTLFIAAVVALVAIAYALSSQRDMGAGLLPQRSGPAVASPGLRSPLALAWRLHRGTLLAWAGSFAVLGAMFGYIVQIVAEQLGASPDFMAFLNQMGGGAGPSDAIFAIYLAAFGPVIAIYAIQGTLRLRSEETEMRADPVLAASVGRVRWAASHLVFAAAGPGVALAALGLTAGLFYGLSGGDMSRELPRVLVASMAYLPAVWVTGGIAALLFGVLPRFAAPLSWAALSGFMLIELGRELQQVSQLVADISPFTHVPKLLVGEASTISLAWLIAIAAALTLVGLAGLRYRDIG